MNIEVALRVADGKVEVVDRATGKPIENIKSAHVLLRAGKPPAVTLETVDLGVRLDVQATAELKANNREMLARDIDGKLWVDAAVLAAHIRELGTMCMLGPTIAFEMRFSQAVLEEWANQPATKASPNQTDNGG